MSLLRRQPIPLYRITLILNESPSFRRHKPKIKLSSRNPLICRFLKPPCCFGMVLCYSLASQITISEVKLGIIFTFNLSKMFM